MLRLRHAIERASRRRWLGVLVVLFLALLLVLLVFHTIEHGLEEGTFLTCFAVLVFLTATFGLERLKLRRHVFASSGRGPPAVPVPVAVRRARWPAGAFPPLRR